MNQLRIESTDHDDFRVGKGCINCTNSGYSGRIAIYEVLHINFLDDITIKHGITEHDVLEAAKIKGMKLMCDDGVEKARKGICSLEDLSRVVA
jgi:type II secretory ATPase GspE/PulE/Tfp pilus assembly ATPase PilB-like protein